MKTGKLPLAILLVAAFAASTAALSLDFLPRERAAFVPLNGQIQPSSGGFGSSGITPGEVRELNQRALDRGVSAIIYEINSGGGAVVASKEIMREVDRVQVPTVCRLRDVAASGAYLVALGCDRIVADSATLTGSIGVKASYLEFSGLLDRYGIEYVNITSGRLKDASSRYMNTSAREKRLLKEKIEKVHEQFLETVREERNLSREQMEEIRTGEVFLGSRAKELGLVDSLGGRAAAVREAENLTGQDLETFEVRQRTGFDIFSLLMPELSLENFFGSGSPLKASYP